MEYLVICYIISVLLCALVMYDAIDIVSNKILPIFLFFLNLFEFDPKFLIYRVYWWGPKNCLPELYRCERMCCFANSQKWLFSVDGSITVSEMFFNRPYLCALETCAIPVAQASTKWSFLIYGHPFVSVRMIDFRTAPFFPLLANPHGSHIFCFQ